MILSEDIFIYEYGYDRAKEEAYEILRRRFMERYEVEPSQIEKDSKGMFGTVPTYREGNTNLLVDSLVPEFILIWNINCVTITDGMYTLIMLILI